jgi:hypothetical protein
MNIVLFDGYILESVSSLSGILTAARSSFQRGAVRRQGRALHWG